MAPNEMDWKMLLVRFGEIKQFMIGVRNKNYAVRSSSGAPPLKEPATGYRLCKAPHKEPPAARYD